MRRVILLGASNLTLGFPLIVRALRAALGPIDLLAAHGHGRSYGMGSRVIWRGLPSIRSCRLWDELSTRPDGDLPPLALITDVGNDIVYGASVDQILGWVESCLVRLAEHHARITVATLPMGSVRRLGWVRYKLTKSFFFPGRGPAWHSMRQLAADLDDGLQRLANSHGAAIIVPSDEWYGFDPIHIARSKQKEAWCRILGGWTDLQRERVDRNERMIGALRLWRLRPASRTIWGRRQETAQPALRLPDGTTVSLY